MCVMIHEIDDNTYTMPLLLPKDKLIDAREKTILSRRRKSTVGILAVVNTACKLIVASRASYPASWKNTQTLQKTLMELTSSHCQLQQLPYLYQNLCLCLSPPVQLHLPQQYQLSHIISNNQERLTQHQTSLSKKYWKGFWNPNPWWTK